MFATKALRHKGYIYYSFFAPWCLSGRIEKVLPQKAQNLQIRNKIIRRKDKEITDNAEIESIICRSMVCRLAMADKNRPYIVPLCFGYKDNTLYFHSAGQGKKLDMLKKNYSVCFEFDIDYEPIKSDKVCVQFLKRFNK
ncbi:MAG: uncharacterized protein SRB2_00961 [Desulfobacteraceae bacterium Eth-SRB2]|nr:MAG: uncharacterized protein SRB2_00961 [Desulfobacteraceae bacterium Eth-SRB2]